MVDLNKAACSIDRARFPCTQSRRSPRQLCRQSQRRRDHDYGQYANEYGHPAQRAAYRGIYLGNDPAAYAELSLVLGRLEMAASDWGAIRARVLVASERGAVVPRQRCGPWRHFRRCRMVSGRSNSCPDGGEISRGYSFAHRVTPDDKL
jgi:hypothetical protein